MTYLQNEFYLIHVLLVWKINLAACSWQVERKQLESGYLREAQTWFSTMSDKQSLYLVDPPSGLIYVKDINGMIWRKSLGNALVILVTVQKMKILQGKFYLTKAMNTIK